MGCDPYRAVGRIHIQLWSGTVFIMIRTRNPVKDMIQKIAGFLVWSNPDEYTNAYQD